MALLIIFMFFWNIFCITKRWLIHFASNPNDRFDEPQTLETQNNGSKNGQDENLEPQMIEFEVASLSRKEIHGDERSMKSMKSVKSVESFE